MCINYLYSGLANPYSPVYLYFRCVMEVAYIQLICSLCLLSSATIPCSSDPGCDQICFTGANNQSTCDCSAKYELQSDGKTCKGLKCSNSLCKSRYERVQCAQKLTFSWTLKTLVSYYKCTKRFVAELVSNCFIPCGKIQILFWNLQFANKSGISTRTSLT